MKSIHMLLSSMYKRLHYTIMNMKYSKMCGKPENRLIKNDMENSDERERENLILSTK